MIWVGAESQVRPSGRRIQQSHRQATTTKRATDPLPGTQATHERSDSVCLEGRPSAEGHQLLRGWVLQLRRPPRTCGLLCSRTRRLPDQQRMPRLSGAARPWTCADSGDIVLNRITIGAEFRIVSPERCAESASRPRRAGDAFVSTVPHCYHSVRWHFAIPCV
jgi:hypothetical protein